MKKLLLLLLITLITQASPIIWQNNLQKAIFLAEKEHKNILVSITASRCGYCEKMKREIFNNVDTAKMLQKEYVLVKMNISKASKIFPNTYVTPTIYIFTPQKELLASQVGYQNEEFFFWTLGDADRKLKELKGKK
jgi:thioredoxin-like negative regulator of GroEL